MNKKMLSLVLSGMLMVGMVGCSSEELTENAEPTKEVVVKELDATKEYKVYDLQTNPNALNEAVEEEPIEIIGEVGIILETGTMGAIINLNLNYPDDGWMGYPIEIHGTMEAFEGLEEGDKIKVQGIYKGVGQYVLDKQLYEMGEDVELGAGAHKVVFRNIYKYE